MGAYFNFPVYRRGVVCSINEPMLKAETEEIANHIILKWRRYFSSFINQFEEIGLKNIQVSDEEIKRETAETTILTFPKFTFDLDGYQIRCRNSLAICSENHNSKIWAKFACQKQDTNFAYNLSPEKVKAFYDLAEEKARGMLDKIIPEYENIAKKAKTFDSINRDHTFKIMATNSNDETIRDIFDGIKGFSITRLRELVENEKYFKALEDFFSIALEKKLDPLEYKELIKNNGKKWIGYETESYCSLFFVDSAQDSTRFSGLTYNQINDYSGQSPAEDSSRAVLRKFARLF